MSTEFDDEIVNQLVDQEVILLKENDRNRDSSAGDEVYYECLIRADLESDGALKILQNQRPNLVCFIIYNYFKNRYLV